MMVGASVVEVPVPNGTLMAGFAARDEPSAGVNDPLTVRALVIEDACWITVDVCGLDEATCRSIIDGTRSPFGRVVLSATHTHSGPGAMPARLRGCSAEVLTAICRAATRACSQATQNRRLCSVAYAALSNIGVARNRRHPEIQGSDREAKMIGRLAPQVEGLIIASSRLPERSLVTIAQRQPTVLINRDIAGIARVLISASDALIEGIDHFVRAGHSRIAYVGGPPRSWSDGQRHGSVVRALANHGLEGLFFQAPTGTHADGLTMSDDVLESGATAVVAFDDVIAHGLVSGFRARGLQIPDDICILGCDDTLAVTTYPPLSSVSLDLSKAARQAVETLRATGDREVIEQRIELEGTLVLRGTTG